MTKRKVILFSILGLNSEMSKATTLSETPLLKQIIKASSAVNPIVPGQLTPGASQDLIESISNETNKGLEPIDMISLKVDCDRI